jgi:hypothetical protein
LANSPIDISVLGKIILSEFEELNSNKFQKHLSEFVFEHIDPAQLESHVEFNDESFRSLTARLRFLFSKARNKAG